MYRTCLEGPSVSPASPRSSILSPETISHQATDLPVEGESGKVKNKADSSPLLKVHRTCLKSTFLFLSFCSVGMSLLPALPPTKPQTGKLKESQTRERGKRSPREGALRLWCACRARLSRRGMLRRPPGEEGRCVQFSSRRIAMHGEFWRRARYLIS